jgi:hypothetical protein
MPNIIDIIKHETRDGYVQTFLVLDTLPKWAYQRDGNSLIAHDDGFYDFLKIEPGSKDAFAGRKFTIELVDGTPFECHGQVWACGGKADEPLIQLGVGTIESLSQCYVFSSAMVVKSKVDAWLAANTPSNRYYKYDPKCSIEYQESIAKKYASRFVSSKRARKLRQSGRTIFRRDKGIAWCPHFERRKSDILSEIANDPGSIK